MWCPKKREKNNLYQYHYYPFFSLTNSPFLLEFEPNFYLFICPPSLYLDPLLFSFYLTLPVSGRSMESYEATRAVFSRVQSIDPENASKIMGYILLHHGEKDMIRFAYGPETLIVSIVNRAKTDLGLLSNTSSAPVVNPISNPIAISRPVSYTHLTLPTKRIV